MTERFRVQSAIGKGAVSARLTLPEGKPRALVQLVHGMQEHCGRYAEYRDFLLDRGFAVGEHDHIGHGESASGVENLGHLGEGDAADALVEDMWRVNRELRRRLPDTPVVALGHSMGALVTRVYLGRHSDTLDGAILSGMVAPDAKQKIGVGLADAFRLALGPRARSTVLDRLTFGSYNRKIQHPRTRFDWLTTDGEEVDKYIADPYCGVIFTTASFSALARLAQRAAACTPMRPDLPILLVSGDQDPCGGYGAGLGKVVGLLRQGGAQEVELKLYPGSRHELHHESCRQEYMAFVADWIDRKVAAG